jgi:methylated-DNA-[protein]-cysteine S-methyltransferase
MEMSKYSELNNWTLRVELSEKHPGKISRVHFVPDSGHNNKKLARAVKAAKEYFQGKFVDFPLEWLDLEILSDSKRKILVALRELVPAGKVITYGKLAEVAGMPGAARFAGSVMRNNPFPLFFPCHRVVGADRSLGGFMGTAQGGSSELNLKKYLLIREGIVFDAENRIDYSYFIS